MEGTGPKTTVKFNDSLEELRELRKAVVFMVIVYYSERILAKISRGKKLLGQNSGDTRECFQFPSPVGFLQIALTSPSNILYVWQHV